MPSPDIHLPPVVAIEAALRKTTQRLACEVAAPAADTPGWSDFEWRVAMAVAVMQGVTVLLANRLLWQGPDLWQAFLAEQKHHGALRQQRIAELLAHIDRVAKQAGIALVALKGSALHGLGVYGPGERPMGDIDLLVQSEDFEATGLLLKTLRYAAELTTWRHQTFAPESVPAWVGFGEHVDNPIKIELHTRIMERLPAFDTEITAQVFPHPALAGLNPYPSNASLMRHLLLHAAGNVRARALRLIQLQDVALLSTRLNAADWDKLLTEGVGPRGLWWALPPLALTARYYPAPILKSVLGQLEKGCPALLLRLSRKHQLADVSWSQIRIQAFPGVEWSRSPLEALKFMADRVFPDHESLALLRLHSVTQPSATGTPWYGLSHPRRILRWLLSQPPRVQTMHSLRLAMAYRPT